MPAAFYINKLILAKLIGERINPTYDSMFAVSVDEMSWDDLDEQHYDWPPVAEVQAYRDRVRAIVDELIQKTPPALLPRSSAPCQSAGEESQSRRVSKSVETITSNLCSSGSRFQNLSRAAETALETIRDVLTTFVEVRL